MKIVISSVPPFAMTFDDVGDEGVGKFILRWYLIQQCTFALEGNNKYSSQTLFMEERNGRLSLVSAWMMNSSIKSPLFR